MRLRIPVSNSSKRAPPPSLARYMATSASRTTASAEWLRPSETTMPTEALTTTGRSSTTTGAFRASSSRWATSIAPRSPGRPSHSSANSSPPMRASVSLSATSGAEPQRDLAEQLVAALVAERVVDELEAVDVEHEHGDRAAVARGERERVVHAVDEQRAVGQARERVVQRPVLDLLLERDHAPERVVETRVVRERLGRHAVEVAASGSSWFISAQKAATTIGSNWRPAQRQSSSNAVAAGSASR